LVPPPPHPRHVAKKVANPLKVKEQKYNKQHNRVKHYIVIPFDLGTSGVKLPRDLQIAAREESRIRQPGTLGPPQG